MRAFSFLDVEEAEPASKEELDLPTLARKERP
jgi:hypothetical protein